ncbi:MAG: hypothetical protein K0Q91_1823 [Fibrobacteria bacterium]|jgi:catechol 2,3-dioxygenase-like lactoylglutathione lyase family enzyme|nr:hypothetical protein [Fibrobacteria bacterium]
MFRPFMVPLLPCRSIDPVLEFYAALGFEVTYRQKSPNVYAAIRYGEHIHLHFYVMKSHAPEKNHGTCLVILEDPEALHAALTAHYRKAKGTVPLTGFPRIPRWRAGQTRFNVADPAGNIIRFISHQESSGPDWVKSPENSGSILSTALVTALKLRNGKGDEAMAAAALDRALRAKDGGNVRERARAIALRCELASVLGESTLLDALLNEFAGLNLDVMDRDILGPEIREMEKLNSARN